MSEKSIAQKLLIRGNYRVLLINAPRDYESKIGRLPPNVTVLTEPTESVDLVQVFVTSKEELEHQLKRLRHILSPRVLLWVTYPKGTSKIKTDINRDTIRMYAESIDLKAVAMIAVDETWSALRLKTK